jgi:hypothetical protein
MPFEFESAKVCPQCPHGLCIADVRVRRIANRDTEFRITQNAALACTFDSFAPGTASDPEPDRTFDAYINQFTGNIRRAGAFLHEDSFRVKPGAVSKVEGDAFELIEAAAIWEAAAAWNRFMDTDVWDSTVFTRPPNSIATPARKIAVFQLPRGYDSTHLFKPEVRRTLEAFEESLRAADSELRLSCPDIVGVRLPEPLPPELEIFKHPIRRLDAITQRELADAHLLIAGKMDGRSLLFAIAAKRSVRSDRLYQPLFEANVLKFLVGEVLRGSSFRFHVHVGSFAGADVEGHYRAASLVSLLRGGGPTRAVDRLYHATHPLRTAQMVLEEFPLFPL